MNIQTIVTLHDGTDQHVSKMQHGKIISARSISGYESVRPKKILILFLKIYII